MCSCRGGYEGSGCEGGPECLGDEGGPLPEYDRRPFAVCAPGNRFLAELVLALNGEQAIEVRESQFLEGPAVYVITPPDFSQFVPQFTQRPEPSMSSVLRDRALAMALAPPAFPLMLGSIT